MRIRIIFARDILRGISLNFSRVSDSSLFALIRICGNCYYYYLNAFSSYMIASVFPDGPVALYCRQENNGPDARDLFLAAIIYIYGIFHIAATP